VSASENPASLDEVDAWKLPDSLPLSREQHFAVLERDLLAQAIEKYLDGDFSRIPELFSISQEEYVAWDLARPIKDDGWVRTIPGSQDGIYFVGDGANFWRVYQQDRGSVMWMEFFQSYDEARKFFAVEHGLGRHLRPR
jgi:hypothetical protein